MTSRVALLLVALAGIAGCYEWPPYPYRGPCPEGETCCPAGSHQAYDKRVPTNILCVSDDIPCGDPIICNPDPCADAGADAGVCHHDAGTDAH